MRPQPSVFVQKALETLGMSQTELGDALKKRNPYQTVHGWITGRKKLEYADVIDIAQMCGWLNFPGDETAEDVFSRSMMGQLVQLLDREPQLLRHHGDLLRAAAAELRNLALRMEAAAENQDGASLPG